MEDAVGQNGRTGEGPEGDGDEEEGFAKAGPGRCRRGSDVSPSFATEAAWREHCVASAQPFCSLKVFFPCFPD